MDKKEELPQDKPKEEITNLIDETNNETIKDFLGDQPKEEPEKEPKEPEKPKEEPKEPEVEVPLEEIIDETIKKSKEDMKLDILKAIGMSDKEKAEAEGAGFKFPWEKRGEVRPKDWEEVAKGNHEYSEFIRTQNESERKAELDKIKENEDKRIQKVNTRWDEQLDYLRSEGLIPEINTSIKEKLKNNKLLTAEERKDSGLVAQAEIFETMYKISLDLENKGEEPISDIIHIYNRFYKPGKKLPPGASAPVSGGKGSVDLGDDDLGYDQLHNANLEDLVKH